MAGFARPEGIDADATVESLEQVDKALREVAWLKYRHNAITTSATQRTAKIMADAVGEMFLDDLGVSFQDREAALTQSIDAWCEANLDQLLEEGGELLSIKLTHGTIGKRKSPDAVVFVKSESKAVEAITAKWSLVEKLKRLTQTVIDALSLGQLVTVKLAIAKPSIKSLWDARPDLHDTLKALGVKVETGKSKRFAEPVEYVVAPDQ